MDKNSNDFIEITFQFLDLCGVCPNTIQNEFIPWTKKVSNGLLALLPSWNLIVFMVMIYKTEQDIFVFINIMGAITVWISYILAIVVPLIKPAAQVRFFQILEETQKVMFSLGIAQPTVVSKTVQLSYIVSFIIFPVMMTAFLVAHQSSFYETVADIAEIMVLFASLIKMKMMLLLVHKKFEALNDRLEEVCVLTLEAIRKGNEMAGNITSKLRSNEIYTVPIPKIAFIGISVEEIHKFNEAHFRLCDAHRAINEMFSVAGIFFPLVVSIGFVRIFISPSNLTFTLFNIMYGSLLMILFISVLTSATNVKNNSLKTGYLIHELLVEEHPTEIEQELEFFSHILKHRKVQLSAEGFFILDLKILTKMMCTLVPLILILVQRKSRSKTA